MKAYDSEGVQLIIDESFASKSLELLDNDILKDPASTYCDPQCGSGTLLLYLAELLNDALKSVIPDDVKRLKHIFTNQLFANDIDCLQTRVCKSNFKKAINDKDAKVNVTNFDYKEIHEHFTCVVSAVQFNTTNDFVPWAQQHAIETLILTKPNKIRYQSHPYIKEITKYRYLGETKTWSQIAAFYFNNKNSQTGVTFVTDQGEHYAENPTMLPTNNWNDFLFAQEIVTKGFPGYRANYGSFYRTVAKENPGDIPIVFNVGKKTKSEFEDIIYVDERIVTEKEGVGKNKVLISKNGNRGKQSHIKFGSPTVGTGHNTIWVDIQTLENYKEFDKYYYSPEIKKLCEILSANNPANGVSFWAGIPLMQYYNEVKKIYDKYYN